MGFAHSELGDHSKAIASYGKALEIARETGEKADETFYLDKMGLAHMNSENHSRAVGLFEKAWEIARESGDEEEEKRLRRNMGFAHLFGGHPEKAKAALYDAEPLYKGILQISA